MRSTVEYRSIRDHARTPSESSHLWNHHGGHCRAHGKVARELSGVVGTQLTRDGQQEVQKRPRSTDARGHAALHFLAEAREVEPFQGPEGESPPYLLAEMQAITPRVAFTFVLAERQRAHPSPGDSGSGELRRAWPMPLSRVKHGDESSQTARCPSSPRISADLRCRVAVHGAV